MYASSNETLLTYSIPYETFPLMRLLTSNPVPFDIVLLWMDHVRLVSMRKVDHRSLGPVKKAVYPEQTSRSRSSPSTSRMLHSTTRVNHLDH